jgi:hypothetical protein
VTATDALDEYLANVPRHLNAVEWRAFRRQCPPPHLRPENRSDVWCGVCGGRLGTFTRICIACHRRESDVLARRPERRNPTTPQHKEARDD